MLDDSNRPQAASDVGDRLRTTKKLPHTSCTTDILVSYDHTFKANAYCRCLHIGN